MSTELWLIGALSCLLVILVASALYRPKQTEIYTLVKEIIHDDRTFYERVVIPTWRQLVAYIMAWQPKGVNRQLVKQNLMYAGQLGRFTPEEFYLIKVASSLIFPAIPFIWFLVSPTALLLMVMAAAGITGYMLPNLWLSRQISRRQKAIKSEIIPFVELLGIACEAGLHSTEAIKHVVRQLKGVLADEWRHTLYSCEAGIPRREALLALSERNGVEELTQLVSLIMQADRLGTPISRALYIQAQQMRMYRRNKISEQAQKAELKILFPLLIFVFGPFALMLIAPAVFTLIGGLK